MALDQLKLDDLNWADMVAAIRRRIPAASDGRWTLHAPVDPGVTLLELFAYLLEQRVYWLDQTPDTLVHALLGLAGFERRPARAASTVFRFSPREFETLPASTQMRLAGRTPPLVFSTESEMTVLPLEESVDGRYRVNLFVEGQERTADLEQGREVCVFNSNGGAGEARVVLWARKDLKPAAGKRLTLLFDLDTPDSVAPQWSHEAARGVRPPADVRWFYNLGGTPAPFPAGAVEDGTGGLRRSGIVALTVPGDWEADTDIAAPPGLLSYSLRLRVERATFSSPPRLRRLIPNVCVARHLRQTVEHALDVKDFGWIPTLPGNQLPLTQIPAGAAEPDFPPLEDTVELKIVERDGEHNWERRQSLAFAGPEDRVFLIERETGALRFGDGLTGRLPVADTMQSPNVKLRYAVGGGPSGNLGENLSWEVVGESELKARNVFAADGGAETETLDEARQRATAELRRVKRAVTAPDHETVVLTTPGVAFKRAHYAAGHHPAHPCGNVPGAGTVYVVPDVPRAEEGDEDAGKCAFVAAPAPDAGALEAARARLEAARLVAGEAFVRGALYREVSLAVVVSGDPVDANAMRRRLTSHMQTFLDPLRGGDKRSGWPFGEPLRPSVMLREAQAAVGEDGEVTSVAIGLDGEAPAESCVDVAIKPHELVTLGELTVRLRRSAAGGGGLR